MMKPSHERFPELDLWRGLSVLAMIVFHIFFFLNYFEFLRMEYWHGGWRVYARMIQWSFFLLVGIGLHLSYQHHLHSGQPFFAYLKKILHRSLIVFSAAMLATVFTGIVFPEDTIYFGVLHFIGMSIFVVGLLVAPRPFIAPFLALLVYVLSLFIHGVKTSSLFLMPLGFELVSFRTFDYFPIFPWIAIPMLGVFLGSVLYPKGQQKWNISFPDASLLLTIIFFMGRHALLIYLLHAPVVVALLYGIAPPPLPPL